MERSEVTTGKKKKNCLQRVTTTLDDQHWCACNQQQTSSEKANRDRYRLKSCETIPRIGCFAGTAVENQRATKLYNEHTHLRYTALVWALLQAVAMANGRLKVFCFEISLSDFDQAFRA